MTAVESAAIQDSAFRTRFDTLFLVKLNEDDAPPLWVPKRHIYYSLPAFGFEGLVGAIKGRVLELGGRLHRLSLTELAALKRERADDEMRRNTTERSAGGLRQVEANVLSLIEETGSNLAKLKDILGEMPASFENDRANWGCVVRLGRHKLSIYWENSYVGTSTHGTLTAINLESASQHLASRPARGSEIEKKIRHYSARLSVGDQWVWFDDNTKDEFTNLALIDMWLRELIELAWPDNSNSNGGPTITFLNLNKRR